MTIAICFGQFGPYHHARVAALQQEAAKDKKTKSPKDEETRVVPIQIAAATSTYAWSASAGACADLRTLCEGTDEAASPFDVFLKARKLFREEKVDVAFLPSYSPARFFSLFAAAKSLRIRTVMMNESHAGTEQATGLKRWIKCQVVKRFDAALVGGEPHKRHFASLGIPADKIFTGYDAVDNAHFAARADAVRKKSDEWRVTCDELGKQSESLNVREAYGLPERYFLSLGRMVEKKNLATLVAAYGRYCDECRVSSDGSARQAPVALVFVGSGELEGALREQARELGLRVVDRTDWKAAQSSHSRVFETAEGKLTRIDADKSERLAADRTGETANSRVTPAVGRCPTEQTDDCKLTTDVSAAQRGAVYFYGFRQIEENPVFYALAEAFVLPSLKEEWGLVVNEAMAAGLPVIVSRTAGCAEDLVPEAPASRSSQCSVGSIQSGEEKKTEDRKLVADDLLEERSNGFVFDPKSCDALCEALRRIADEETNSRVFETARGRAEGKLKGRETNGLTEMGKRSREIVAKFSCENFAHQALRAAEAARA